MRWPRMKWEDCFSQKRTTGELPSSSCTCVSKILLGNSRLAFSLRLQQHFQLLNLSQLKLTTVI